MQKMFEYRILKTQLQRLVIYLDVEPLTEPQQRNKQCMLRLCCAMLKQIDPDMVEMQIRRVAR